MKRILLVSALLLASVSLFAAKPFKVTKGSLNVLKVDKFERTQGPGVWGSCYISVYGTLCVVDAASGETALEIQVNNVKGDTDFVETDRFPKTMNWLCRDLFKLKK